MPSASTFHTGALRDLRGAAYKRAASSRDLEPRRLVITMADCVFCKNCGKPIEAEPPNVPCPRCGSIGRSFNLLLDPVHFSVDVSDVTGVVITYPEALLRKAQELIATGDFSIAVVVAHMACEISAERAISRAFAVKGIGYLEESILAFLPGYNLATERIRNFYNAVTGNQIQDQSFWQAFTESATRRNNAVHKGRIVTKAEAEESYKAAHDLVAYLK